MSNLKAESLMRGDLVLLNGKVIIVDAVHKRKIGYHPRSDKMSWVFEGQFQPVPITEAMLLGCGFKKVETPQGVLYTYVWNERIWVSLNGTKDPRVWAIHVQGIIGILNGVGAYMHELQHDLGVCGMNTRLYDDASNIPEVVPVPEPQPQMTGGARTIPAPTGTRTFTRKDGAPTGPIPLHPNNDKK